jgi:hypothetical protein
MKREIGVVTLWTPGSNVRITSSKLVVLRELIAKNKHQKILPSCSVLNCVDVGPTGNSWGSPISELNTT